MIDHCVFFENDSTLKNSSNQLGIIFIHKKLGEQVNNQLAWFIYFVLKRSHICL